MLAIADRAFRGVRSKKPIRERAKAIARASRFATREIGNEFRFRSTGSCQETRNTADKLEAQQIHPIQSLLNLERQEMGATIPRVVIVGGGFGGLAAAKALKHTPAQITLIDRTNHHLFQPLLYQVATSELTPGQIGSPIRNILGKQSNTTVILGEVTGVDKDEKCIFADGFDRSRVPIPYDYLVLATGVTHSYFGHEEFARHAPGLKTLADAVAVRNKILEAFEQAEAEEDPARHRDPILALRRKTSTSPPRRHALSGKGIGRPL